MLGVHVGDRLLGERFIYANTPSKRAQGVLGMDKLDVDQGVLMQMPSRLKLSMFYSIHMFGVPFALAVAWLDEKGKVLYAVEAQPGHFYLPRPVLIDVSHILEAHPSHLAALCLNSEVQWMTVADEAQRI